MVALALLAIPNTYEENQLYLEVQKDEVQKDNAAIAPVSSYSFIQLPQRQSVSINSRSFNTETIALGPENTDIKTKPDPQKKKESLELWELVTSTTPELYTEGPLPLRWMPTGEPVFRGPTALPIL